MAMSEASKLFDSSNGGGGGDKQAVISGAAMTVMKLMTQQSGGGGGGGMLGMAESMIGGGNSGGLGPMKMMSLVSMCCFSSTDDSDFAFLGFKIHVIQRPRNGLLKKKSNVISRNICNTLALSICFRISHDFV
jgi:hypothetical protein